MDLKYLGWRLLIKSMEVSQRPLLHARRAGASPRGSQAGLAGSRSGNSATLHPLHLARRYFARLHQLFFFGLYGK